MGFLRDFFKKPTPAAQAGSPDTRDVANSRVFLPPELG